MADGQSVDISRLIDEQGITAFNVRLIIFAFFIVLFDGYDISALGFAVPELVKAWNVTDRSTLGPVLSASLVGMLLGAPLLGALGDRFGRKGAIIGACLIFGALLGCRRSPPRSASSPVCVFLPASASADSCRTSLRSSRSTRRGAIGRR